MRFTASEIVVPKRLASYINGQQNYHCANNLVSMKFCVELLRIMIKSKTTVSISVLPRTDLGCANVLRLSPTSRKESVLT